MTTVTVQEMSAVTQAIVASLQADPWIANAGVKVERSTVVNEDMGRCPWIGVYKRHERFAPRTVPQNWVHDVEVVLWLQEKHMGSGPEAEDRLSLLLSNTLRVIFSDPTLRQTVQMSNEVDVSYQYDEKEGDVHFQSALVSLTGKTVTGYL